MKKSRILAILLCCVLLLGVAACGGSDSGGGGGGGGTADTPAGGSDTGGGGGGDSGAAAATGRDTLNVAVTGDMGTLNYTTVTGDYAQVLDTVFEPLWKVTFTGERIYLLAESYEVHDSRHWTIKLKPGITFSNGNPFTASDFIFSAELARDIGGIASAGRIQDFDWDNFKAVDDLTIDMRWTTDRSENIFFEIIAVLPMFDEESYDDARAAVNPIGTGPYVVTDYTINSHCFLERREDYWGEMPSIKYLNFRVLNEPAQRVNALVTGDIDIAQITSHDVDYVKGIDGFDVLDRFTATWAAMRFNIVQGRLFHNEDARRAVVHALNRQAMLDVVYGGFGEVLNGPMTRVCLDYSPSFDFTDDTYTVGYNLDVAKQHAERAGIAGDEVVIITNGTPEHVRIAEMMLNMLDQIGLVVQINNYDVASYTDVSRNPEMYDIAITRDFAPTLFYGGGLTNTIRYSTIFTAPGSWEEAETFADWGVNVFFATNIDQRQEITQRIVELVTGKVLLFPLVDYFQSTAFATDLPTPFTYSQGSVLQFNLSLR